MAANYRMIAIRIGDLLKYDTTVNEVNRLAGAIFTFPRQSFPNDAITSERARLIHDWVLTLAKQKLEEGERDRLVASFCSELATEALRPRVGQILSAAGVAPSSAARETNVAFAAREFHPEVVKHARKLFTEGNYFHAVFEVAKVYNKLVREKAHSDSDGQSLMLAVWGCDKGVLKVTACKSETDRNVQDGIKFLSAGLMQAVRNPTAHEPAVDWPISRRDCLDLLSFMSFLFRKLDDAVFVAR